MVKHIGMFIGIALLAVASVTPASATESYGEAIGTKAAMGFSNIALAWLELPKNVIATTNQTNLAVGLTGGTIKGIVHTAGRILSGAADFLTFPYPTQPITQPGYIWQDFGVETQYGPIFVRKDLER